MQRDLGSQGGARGKHGPGRRRQLHVHSSEQDLGGAPQRYYGLCLAQVSHGGQTRGDAQNLQRQQPEHHRLAERLEP